MTELSRRHLSSKQQKSGSTGENGRTRYRCCRFFAGLQTIPAKLLVLFAISSTTTLLLLLVRCRQQQETNLNNSHHIHHHYPLQLLSCCDRTVRIVVAKEEHDDDDDNNYIHRVARNSSSNHRSNKEGFDKIISHHRKLQRQPKTRRRLPTCLIIGVRKGGTRALLEFLSLHPSIQAQKQEVHFFDDHYNYARGLGWYRKKMRYSTKDQITIEKTPAYFVGERVPSRVHAMNKTIRLILAVRDPVERAISDYMQIYSSRHDRGKTHSPFEELVIDHVTGEVNVAYKPIRRSIYHRHLERWLRYFPIQQFHFVNSENLVRNPIAELRKVEDFLEIEPHLDENLFYFNQTRGFFCMRRRANNSTAKCLASSKGRLHPQVDVKVIGKLRRFFRQHNARFYDMANIDFGWA